MFILVLGHLSRFIAHFAHVRIEDSSRNRFALNGIQRDVFGGVLSGYANEYKKNH